MKIKVKIAAILFLLASCSGNKDYSEMTDVEIYDRGVAAVKDENFPVAIADLENIEYHHPYSKYIGRAQIMIGYANYRYGKFKEAADSFEKFVRFQPSSSEVPYATYMTAMSNFALIRPVEREQRETATALQIMERIVRDYPTTPYAADVQPRIIIASDRLAGKEMFIAKGLSAKRNIVAALNHYQVVVSKYPNTVYAPEAYFRAAEIYNIIGEPAEADKLLKTLREKYPLNEFAK